MKKLMFTLLISTLPMHIYAWICPNNFKQIASGDTIEQVTAACGKPASEKISEGGYNGPQEWQYFVTIQKQLKGSGAPTGENPSIKMSIAFNNHKAINITVQGMSLSSTSLCGPTINVGDNDRSIEKNCGKPTFIQKQESAKENPIEITEFKYNTAPPNILIFENGILKERK